MTSKKRKLTALTDPRNIGIVWDDAKTAEALNPGEAAPKKATRKRNRRAS